MCCLINLDLAAQLLFLYIDHCEVLSGLCHDLWDSPSFSIHVLFLENLNWLLEYV